MKEISASKFKAQCLAEMEKVRKTRQPILVTKFGEPLVEIVPANPPKKKDWMGKMKGKMEIVGDIVGPIIPEEDWDMLK